MQHCKVLICNLLVISYTQQGAPYLESTTDIETYQGKF